MKIIAASIFIISCTIMSCNSPSDQPAENVEPKINYLEYGKNITAIAQAELMKNVKEAMSKGGPVYAIEHCNVHATPLSDSIANEFEVDIQRLSFKYRNPNNAPTEKEDKILLNEYLEKLNEGLTIRDTILRNLDNFSYYRPILISMETCLKCHGQPGEEINTETMLAINKRYPEDRAINFRMGEFRGVWKVSFSEKSE